MGKQRAAKEILVYHLTERHKCGRLNKKAEGDSDGPDDEQKLQLKVSKEFKIFYEKCKSGVKKYYPNEQESKRKSKLQSRKKKKNFSKKKKNRWTFN